MPSGVKCVIRCSPAVADVKRKPAQGTQGHRVARETTTAVALSHTLKNIHTFSSYLSKIEVSF